MARGGSTATTRSTTNTSRGGGGGAGGAGSGNLQPVADKKVTASNGTLDLISEKGSKAAGIDEISNTTGG